MKTILVFVGQRILDGHFSHIRYELYLYCCDLFGLIFLSKSEERIETKEMNFESKVANCKQETRVLTDGSKPSLVCDLY